MKTKTSISHLTGKEQNALLNIRKKVVEYTSPLLIFCFDTNSTQTLLRNSFTARSRVESWAFSCNLLVVLPDEATIFSETKSDIEELIAPFGNVNVFVHPLDLVLQKLKDNNLFFTWVQRNAILLYNKDNSWRLLPEAIKHTPEYQQQAERYFTDNPNFENYLDVKIVPPDHGSTQNNQQSVIKKVPIDLPDDTAESPRYLFVQNLSPEQIANPYLVINFFFRDYSLQDARKHINGWMTGVYEKVRWIKEHPSDLLYFIDRCFQLIEAGWLLNQTDNEGKLADLSLQYELDGIDFMDPGLYCAEPYKSSAWNYFPRFLNRSEFLNPYKGIAKFFKFRTLDQWKTELQNIFYLVLSNLDVNHTGETINTFGLVKRLNKFVEACQLINVRELEWADGKLILKINNNQPDEQREKTH